MIAIIIFGLIEPPVSLAYHLFGLGLGLPDGHPVIYALHAGYVVGEFGGQVQFGCVVGLAIQCDHALLLRRPHAFRSHVCCLSCRRIRKPKETRVQDPPLSLLPKNLLNLTDLFLNYAGYPFTGTLGFHLWIIA
jgi:hypothetical protein